MSTALHTSVPAMRATSNADGRWLLVVQLYAAAVVAGVAEIVAGNPVVDWLVSAYMASAAALWVVFDARRRNRPIGHALQFLVFVFWHLAVPVYLIYSRGVRGLGWSLLNAVGLLVTLGLGYYIAGYFAYGPGG